MNIVDIDRVNCSESLELQRSGNCLNGSTQALVPAQLKRFSHANRAHKHPINR